MTGRRLQLVLVKSFIHHGMFKKAVECLLKLISIFEAIPKLDSVQINCYLCVWLELVRISHLQDDWDEAFVRWYRALAI